MFHLDRCDLNFGCFIECLNHKTTSIISNLFDAYIFTLTFTHLHGHISDFLVCHCINTCKQYFLKVWGEVEANNDLVPVEGYNAYITALSFDDFNKVKVRMCVVIYVLKIIAKISYLHNIGNPNLSLFLEKCIHYYVFIGLPFFQWSGFLLVRGPGIWIRVQM